MKNLQYDFSNFISVSNKKYSQSEMLKAIFGFIKEDPDREYRVFLGTDSEGYGDVNYATAVVVHRVGSGARGFICKNKVHTPRSLRQKIYTETALSLALAQEFVQPLTDTLGEKFVLNNLVVHLDVGQYGETRDMIKEVVGMVHGYGFKVGIKPESYAASSVADRFAHPPSMPPTQYHPAA